MGIYEENARFILISLLLVLYLILGAILFHYVERENEVDERRKVGCFDFPSRFLCKLIFTKR
uniref:Potassium channel domain-containing protein n=1 Tax=Angiostrongylus cantonensis TaxID=6313 RepID=A0A0K0DHM5_ANGCA